MQEEPKHGVLRRFLAVNFAVCGWHKCMRVLNHGEGKARWWIIPYSGAPQFLVTYSSTQHFLAPLALLFMYVHIFIILATHNPYPGFPAYTPYYRPYASRHDIVSYQTFCEANRTQRGMGLVLIRDKLQLSTLSSGQMPSYCFL